MLLDAHQRTVRILFVDLGIIIPLLETICTNECTFSLMNSGTFTCASLLSERSSSRDLHCHSARPSFARKNLLLINVCKLHALAATKGKKIKMESVPSTLASIDGSDYLTRPMSNLEAKKYIMSSSFLTKTKLEDKGAATFVRVLDQCNGFTCK